METEADGKVVLDTDRFSMSLQDYLEEKVLEKTSMKAVHENKNFLNEMRESRMEEIRLRQYITRIQEPDAIIMPGEKIQYGDKEQAEAMLSAVQAKKEQLEETYQGYMKKAVIEAYQRYAETVSKVRDLALELKTPSDCMKFADKLAENGINLQNSVELSGKFSQLVKYAERDFPYYVSRQADKKQFLYTETEKALSNYYIGKYNGENVQVGSNEREDCIAFSHGLGTRYTYRNAPEMCNPESWEQGKYFVVDMQQNKVVANHIETEEQAIQFAVEREKQIQETQKQQDGNGRKKPMTPPQLAHIRRKGEDYREERHVTGEELRKTFAMFGGEFGNWENQNERQVNLDMTYGAFKDLAKALKIHDKDISLKERTPEELGKESKSEEEKGALGIAWGARGHAGAAAHYEPVANAINLTRMSGAGSLAHEWGHALDSYLGKQLGTQFATDNWYKKDNPMHDVIEAIKYSPTGGTTKFFEDAKKLDSAFSKTGNQQGKYWQSEVEMFARAFACYVKDTLAENGERNDYLYGHADGGDKSYMIEQKHGVQEQEPVYIQPMGEERKAINAAIRKMLEAVKEKGLLHDRSEMEQHRHIEVDIEVEEEKPKKELSAQNEKKKSIAETEQTVTANGEEHEGEQLEFGGIDTWKKPENAEKTETGSEMDEKTRQELEIMKQNAEKEQRANIEAVMEQAVNQLAQIEIAKQLQEGDTIHMEGEIMLDGRTMKPTYVEGDYAKVTSVSEEKIEFRTFRTPEMKEDWTNGRETIFSTPNNPWYEELAKRGFEPISVKALEKEVPEGEKSLQEKIDEVNKPIAIPEEIQETADLAVENAKKAFAEVLNDILTEALQEQQENPQISEETQQLIQETVDELKSELSEKSDEPIEETKKEVNPEVKGRFTPNKNLMMLESALQEHQPYAMLNVSTTGLDGYGKDAFKGHEPTRVVVQEYIYDEQLRKYQESRTFDEIMKCSPEALQEAIANADKEGGYDVFANGGIDCEAYTKGEGTLERQEFAEKFNGFMQGLLSETVIIANNAEHCQKYLEKVDCGAELAEKAKQHKLISQDDLTQEYFVEHQIEEINGEPRNNRHSLETLNEFLTGEPSPDKLVGGDKRIEVMQAFVTHHGRERGFLEDELTSEFREEDARRMQAYSREGKENYQNADLDAKLDTLVEMRVLEPEKIMERNGDSEINKLFDVLEGKDDTKGFIALQVSTTGFKAGNMPMEFAVKAYEINDGELSPRKGRTFQIQADSESLKKAIQIADTGGFDAFQYNGIDREEYMGGHFHTAKRQTYELRSPEKAVKALDEFFKQYPPEQYPIVEMKGSQASLRNIGNHPAFHTETIDFTKAIQEYCYLSTHDNDYQQNVLVGDNTPC